jgi:hypothetical protein
MIIFLLIFLLSKVRTAIFGRNRFICNHCIRSRGSDFLLLYTKGETIFYSDRSLFA